MPWLLLFAAGLLEIVWATAMKYSAGFTRPTPTIVMIVGMIASFWLLATAMRSLPLGTAYMVWTGIGAVGAFALGILAFGDSAAPLRIAVVCALVAALVGLKLVSDGSPASQLAPAPRPAAR